MTDFEISTRVVKDRVKGREEKRPNALDRVVEKMMPKTTNKDTHETQLLIIRLLLCVGLPLVLILATVEFITRQNVNPLLTVIGTGIMTVLATLLRVNGPEDKTPKGQ